MEKLSDRWGKHGMNEEFVCETTMRIMKSKGKEAWSATEKMIEIFALDKQISGLEEKFDGDVSKLEDASFKEMLEANNVKSNGNGSKE